MTELLYYQDAYLKEFDAEIMEIEAADGAGRIVLDRTAFYPGGGGQPNDTGWIDFSGRRCQVTKLQRDHGLLWHHFSFADDNRDSDNARTTSPAIKTGLTVQAEIDWARRYALMRTHTAMHILCGVVWRDYGASVTGGNMEPGSGRMDFEFASLTRELIDEIEEKCNVEIDAARPVRVETLPRDRAFEIPDLIRTKINLLPAGIKEVRTVELVGLDLQADGGTHVANTREVGGMRVVDYRSKGAINKRIYIELTEQKI